MKRPLILLFLVFIAHIANAQLVNCKNFKDGTFKFTGDSKATVIVRSGNKQLEYFDNAKVPVSFTVKWVDDCTYTLTPNEDVFKKYPRIPRNAVVTVKITKTAKDFYIQMVSSNYDPKTFTGQVFKIK